MKEKGEKKAEEIVLLREQLKHASRLLDLFDDQSSKSFMAVMALYQQIVGIELEGLWGEFKEHMGLSEWMAVKHTHNMSQLISQFASETRGAKDRQYARSSAMKWLAQTQSLKADAREQALIKIKAKRTDEAAAIMDKST
jgi:hypothetical protein